MCDGARRENLTRGPRKLPPRQTENGVLGPQFKVRRSEKPQQIFWQEIFSFQFWSTNFVAPLVSKSRCLLPCWGLEQEVSYGKHELRIIRRAALFSNP